MKGTVKHFLLLVILASLCAFLLTGCQKDGSIKERALDIIARTEAANKLLYATGLEFNIRIVVDEEVHGSPTFSDPIAINRIAFNPTYSNFDPSYTGIIFVYSEEEALQLPDNVITAWPTPRTLGVINGLNWAVESGEVRFNVRNSAGDIDLSEFSLEFPITITDVVENWEGVHELRMALSPGVNNAMSPEAWRGAEAFLDELTQLAKERSEELPEANISQDDILFADRFNFSFRMVVDDEIISSPVEILLYTQVLYPEFNPFYTDFVLTETEEEALLLPDNVIAAWPSQETHEQLNTLNWILQGNTVVMWFESVIPASKESVNLEDFSLQFPLTTSDMIDYPEEFSEMWDALEFNTVLSVRNPASNSRREANSLEFLAELERLRAEREARESD